MAVNVSTSSRLRFADLRIIDGITFWDIAELPTYRTRVTDMFHRVKGSDTVDTLALDFYDSEGFWWVIAWGNDYEILPTDMNEGDVILIPDPEFVRSGLSPRVGNGS